MNVERNSLLELLALLCREGLGKTRIRHSAVGSETTIAEEYVREQRRDPRTVGRFQAETCGGKLMIRSVDAMGHPVSLLGAHYVEAP